MMARADLARLVRSLIDQTNDQVVLLEMRAGEGSEVPGYDGIVEATRGSPFVPEGRSVWELGTGGDPADKASEDYRLRTDNPLGEVQSEVTFVFVTPRRWPKKGEWIAERKKKGSPWKDIKVFDVDAIETGLEHAVGLHFIFSEQLGKPAFGVVGLEEWWKRFSTGSNPVLTPDMVLAGRADDSSNLLRLLGEGVRRTTIAAASTDDVLAFVAATILTSAEDHRMDMLARALIVRDAHTLRVLELGSKLLILLPYDEDLHREAQLIRSHHVVFLAPRDAPADLTIRPLNHEKFAELLRAAGVNENHSRDLARAAVRSLVAFQGLAAPSGARLRPQWTTWLRSQPVRRAWLAAGWTTVRSGDTDVLGELLGSPYGEVEDEVRTAATGEDPLFTVVGHVWGVASAEASWDFVRPLLTGPDLVALERAVQTVLSAIDPALELPPEERWRAAIYGKTRVHSSNLRTGLATSLALLGSLGDSVGLGNGATGRTWAERTVSQVLERANADESAQLWVSLADVLPLLAEAAPDHFLSAVQKGVTGADPVLAKLFVDQEAAFTSSSPHPGMLWALEGLAWSQEHLGLVAESLARLAELDPGGRLSNRPASSLAGIFRPWLPQTSAAPDARLRVLESVTSRHPDVGWSLLVSLLPQMHAVGMYAHMPRFRPWRKTSDTVTVQEYGQVVDGVVARLLDLAEASLDRWPALIERLADLPAPWRAEVYQRLRRLADDG